MCFLSILSSFPDKRQGFLSSTSRPGQPGTTVKFPNSRGFLLTMQTRDMKRDDYQSPPLAPKYWFRVYNIGMSVGFDSLSLGRCLKSRKGDPGILENYDVP